MDGLIEVLVVLILVGIVAAGLVVLAGTVVGRVTVHEYERGVRMDGGQVVGLVGPGTITYLKPRTEIQVVDTRPVARTVDGQEVLTADGVAVKVSLVVRTAVGDPVARLEADQNVDQYVYLLVQLGLREVIAGRDLADVLAARSTIGAEIRDIAAGRLGEVGVELLSVDVRDVMVPAELKRAQAAVITARAEGLASLERARVRDGLAAQPGQRRQAPRRPPGAALAAPRPGALGPWREHDRAGRARWRRRRARARGQRSRATRAQRRRRTGRRDRGSGSRRRVPSRPARNGRRGHGRPRRP